MKHKTREELSKEQSKEYEKIHGRSYEEIQKELNLLYPIFFEEL